MEAANDGGSVINDAWRSYATTCRLCLQKDGFMLGIFNNIQGKDKSISKKIIDCTALSVHQGDGLPNVICHRCLFKIEFCLEFRQLCFISDATLRQLNGIDKDNGSETPPQPHLPLYEHLSNGADDNVIMVVDPNTLDYESDYESDNDRQSDNETNELDGKNVCMCKFCDHAFTDKLECMEHESNAHNSDQPYNCSSCSMDFADRLLYSAHMKSVHKNDKPYNCPQCDRTFARRSDLRKHTIVHTGVKPYTCSVCFKSFSRNTNLSKHMRIHSGTKPFVCQKCPRTFTSKGDLNRHAMIHTGQKPFRCNYCHLSFGRKDKLLRHEKRHWPQQNAEDKSRELQMMRENLDLGEYNYAATPANNGDDDRKTEENMVIDLDPFHHNDYGAEHRSIEHEPKHIIDDYVKDELSVEESSFEEGERRHVTGEENPEDGAHVNRDPRPYKCAQCPKKFSTPDNLKYHQARHTGVRPFGCHICNKSFIRKRELDRHVATHTGVKPFKCPKCHKSFGRKDKLVRHARIHDRRGDSFTARKTFASK
ncbi:zinc finger protein 260 [Cylas formicarius]|uniref:zinc finger protein 260 n=1 Tax=Cylas formicarius TaxID=197179 RepID=UPI0029586A7E|nr:zinc finger protein 260 [Cylas formicarius]